jgi:hypothetical protein
MTERNLNVLAGQHIVVKCKKPFTLSYHSESGHHMPPGPAVLGNWATETATKECNDNEELAVEPGSWFLSWDDSGVSASFSVAAN